MGWPAESRLHCIEDPLIGCEIVEYRRYVDDRVEAISYWLSVPVASPLDSVLFLIDVCLLLKTPTLFLPPPDFFLGEEPFELDEALVFKSGVLAVRKHKVA